MKVIELDSVGEWTVERVIERLRREVDDIENITVIFTRKNGDIHTVGNNKLVSTTALHAFVLHDVIRAQMNGDQDE